MNETPKQQDYVRVLRVVEYEGPRDEVEKTLENSVHGTRRYGRNSSVRISAATLGDFPAVLNEAHLTTDPIALRECLARITELEQELFAVRGRNSDLHRLLGTTNW